MPPIAPLKEPCYGVIDGKENVVIEPKYIYIKPCGNGYVATTSEGDVLPKYKSSHK